MNIYDDKVKNRLKRADGQLQGVLRMMEDKKECIDVITQLTAVRSSLDTLIGVIVAENLKRCLLTDNDDDREAKIEQAIKMIVRK
ncbi:metal-sensitive transcriptional regulator [Aerococcaceae bacterium NML191292]|nr:metal-sensitive transcriptional regulator [Aerococcaceae bacterium NML210727]MCW6655112.1 metal-sensitive transcriptional regulator [Aerococcaceae bacterium NML201296]MCW6660326.1 metal-sensitive transcriptional regulator [Aerococcaceae bacterium NML191292]MCW6661570.1 metal-sensitive transcriptional regulator [Aerococcaceae bacterium NML201209]MCW6663766.1 metal-sensitive transcriptional regulator [Aerococcaceae bacterium NML190073]MCW6665536.1 metal-sensitive transcriptional regulator [Ae